MLSTLVVFMTGRTAQTGDGFIGRGRKTRWCFWLVLILVWVLVFFLGRQLHVAVDDVGGLFAGQQKIGRHFHQGLLQDFSIGVCVGSVGEQMLFVLPQIVDGDAQWQGFALPVILRQGLDGLQLHQQIKTVRIAQEFDVEGLDVVHVEFGHVDARSETLVHVQHVTVPTHKLASSLSHDRRFSGSGQTFGFSGHLFQLVVGHDVTHRRHGLGVGTLELF